MGSPKSKSPTPFLYWCSREIRKTLYHLASGHSEKKRGKRSITRMSSARTENGKKKAIYMAPS